jgi:hypothetical protein
MNATRDIPSYKGQPGSRWRPMREEDLCAVSDIAKALHPDMTERPEVFREKYSLFPAGCLSLELAGNMLGYAVAHPWVLNEIPPLDAFLRSLPARPDCVFLHDVAILQSARGRGATTALIDILSDIACRNGIEALALVSLYGTHIHWKRLGFVGKKNDLLAEKLRDYGPSATYMVKKGAGPID